MYLNKLFLTLLFSSFLVINSFSNELFILPKDNKKVVNHIEKLILNSKKEIKIAIYNFSYKKIAKMLLDAKKNGINITVYFDEKKIKEDDKIIKLFRKNGIKTVVIKDKLHTKLAIFDKKIAYFGSANWTKQSFKENYEILYFTDEKETIKKLNKFLSTLN